MKPSMTTSSLKQQQHSKSSEHYSQPPQQTPLLSMTSTSHQHDPLSHPTTTSDDDTNMQIVALSKDKYEKLIKEFQKYKQKYNKWKKIVNQEESKWKQTQIDLEKKESELRNKIEENDILTFNNQRLEKRMAQLMFDLEEQVNKNRKSTSFFSGLFGTSSSAGGAGSGGGAGNDQPSIHGGNASTFSFFGTSSNNSSMYNELQVLKEELESKIKENEGIHIHLFELKQEHEKTMAKFKHTISDLQHSIYGKDSTIHSLKSAIDENSKKFTNDKEAMKDKMRNLKQEIRNRKDSENTIRNFTVKQHSKLIYYENYIDRKILFDDTKIDSLNLLNIPNCKRNPLEIELLDNLTSILNNLSKNISSTYLYIPQKIQHLNKLTTSQSPLLRFINSKMNTQIDMSTFPNLFSKIIKQCEWYSKSIKDQGTHESSGTSNSSMNSGISTNSGISNNSSSNSNSNNNNTSSSSNNNNISNHNSSIRMDESSGNVQIDSNTIITTHHTTSLLHTLFSTVKDLLKYNRKCLLYLTVTSQEEECELREVYHSSSSTTTMDSSLNHTFKGTTTTSLDMTDGNDNDDDDEYSEFEDGIFMRNTMATRSLKYLLYLYDKFILFIDTFYVRVLEIENYVPIQTSLRRDEKKIRRVFLMTSHDEDHHHSSSSSNSTSGGGTSSGHVSSSSTSGPITATSSNSTSTSASSIRHTTGSTSSSSMEMTLNASLNDSNNTNSTTSLLQVPSHEHNHHSQQFQHEPHEQQQQHLSSLSVDHYSHGEQFIHKLLKSSSNHHVNSTCFNNFSIREEFKLLVKHIGDALKDYTEIVSNLLLKENIKNFISPSIKNINEKLIKSLKSIVLLYESMTIIHRGLMDCERQYDQLYSRGALVDYESILTNKVSHVRNIVNYSGQSGPYRMIQSHDDGRDGRDGSGRDGRYSMIHHDHPLPTMDNDAYNILDTPYYYSSCYYYTDEESQQYLNRESQRYMNSFHIGSSSNTNIFSSNSSNSSNNNTIAMNNDDHDDRNHFHEYTLKDIKYIKSKLLELQSQIQQLKYEKEQYEIEKRDLIQQIEHSHRTMKEMEEKFRKDWNQISMIVKNDHSNMLLPSPSQEENIIETFRIFSSQTIHDLRSQIDSMKTLLEMKSRELKQVIMMRRRENEECHDDEPPSHPSTIITTTTIGHCNDHDDQQHHRVESLVKNSSSNEYHVEDLNEHPSIITPPPPPISTTTTTTLLPPNDSSIMNTTIEMTTLSSSQQPNWIILPQQPPPNDSNIISNSTSSSNNSNSSNSNNSSNNSNISNTLFFTHSELSRERELERKYSKQIEYLLRQIEVCDLKTLQYRIQYQQAIMDLEKAQEYEERLKSKLSHLNLQLENAQEDYASAKLNYEHQIQLLSDKLVEISIKHNIDSSRGSGGDDYNTTTTTSGATSGLGFGAFSSFFGGGTSSSSSSSNSNNNNNNTSVGQHGMTYSQQQQQLSHQDSPTMKRNKSTNK